MATQTSSRYNDRVDKSSATDLKDIASDENVAALLGVFDQFGTFCMNSLRTTADYSRRHPIRVGITLIAIGALGTWLAKSRTSPQLH